MADGGASLDILHDFSDADLKVSLYGGAASKRTMLLDGCQYMLKFGYTISDSAERSVRTSCISTPVCEYIGSKVFAAAGLPTQDVMLGVWKGRSVVACRDFTHGMDPRFILLHFNQLEISMPGGTRRSKAQPDWEYVRHVLDDLDALDGIRERAWRRFRRMACVDALIGNCGRCSNNWGFIADRWAANIIDLAPVYSCGSSLAANLSVETMRQCLDDPALMRAVVVDSPAIAMNVAHKRCKYSYFMTADYAREFRAELPGLWPRLTKHITDAIVDGTPGLDSLHRDFYKTLLDARREYVIEPAYRMALVEREPQQVPCAV